MSDPASTYTRLRAETAALLGVDPDDLSKTEGLRLDITSLLLLEIDSLQGSILANEKVDLARLSTALGMLQKLLPATALVAPALAPDARGSDSEAFRQIAEQIDRQIEQLERKMVSNPDAARAEFEAKLQAALAKYPNQFNVPKFGDVVPDPAGGDAQYTGAVSPSAPVEQAAATAGGSWPAPEHPTLIEPPPKRVESDVERMDRVNSSARPPDRYLKGPREAWRDHIDADGQIISPWFRPSG